MSKGCIIGPPSDLLSDTKRNDLYQIVVEHFDYIKGISIMKTDYNNCIKTVEEELADLSLVLDKLVKPEIKEARAKSFETNHYYKLD